MRLFAGAASTTLAGRLPGGIEYTCDRTASRATRGGESVERAGWQKAALGTRRRIFAKVIQKC